MFQFDFLWALVLLPLPLLVYWLTPEFRDTGKVVRAPIFERVIALTGQEPKSGAVSLLKGWVQKIGVTLMWCLVVVALAKPVWVGEPITRDISARDMLLVVDLSGSMAEKDFTDTSGETITRLAAVKLVLKEFIAGRTGDRLGLAVFGDAAFPQAPFTTDHQTVLTLLDEVETGMAGQKTMIGDAIGLAIKLFEPVTTENKVVILLTDGNDTGSKMPVLQAADIAADQGITIHTIAMGNPENVGENPLDTATLEAISQTTGGGSFLALDSAQLQEVYAELDRLEPEILQTLSYRPKRQLFPYAIGAFLVIHFMLAGYVTLSSRRKAAAVA